MRAVLLLCLLAAPIRAHGASAQTADASDADLEAIKKQLAPFVTLRGSFEQSKKIRVIKKPLRSEGDFALLKDKGVLWRTLTPMTSVLRVSRDDISEIKDGKATILISMKDQPALGIIGKVLFAVFSADVDELKRHFKFTHVARPNQDGHWEASLRPRDSMVRKSVELIKLEGGRTLESLTLDEVNGDSTLIRFKNVDENKSLSKEEAALFE